MQELAHNGTESPTEGRRLSGNLPPYTGGHPSAGMLAAYIDGVLDPVEAERVTAHLATARTATPSTPGRCGSCWRPSRRRRVKLVAFPQPPKIEPPHGSNGVPSPPFCWSGSELGTYFHLLWEPPALKTAEVAEPIPNQPEVFNDVTGIWTGPRYRGGEGETELELDEAAFRTGVQLVNLQVSLQAGKTAEAQDAVAAILGLLQSGILTAELEKKYEGLTGSMESRKPSAFLPEASKLAEETREVFETDSLDLGQWVEAARLAAAAGDATFFQQGDTRSFLRRLLWREKVGLGEVKLDEATRQSLEEVSRILSKDELAASDYSRLTEELGQILEQHYPAAG